MKYLYIILIIGSITLSIIGGRKLYQTGYEEGKRENAVQTSVKIDTVFTEKLVYKDRIRTRTEVETLYVTNETPVIEYVAVQDTTLSDSTYDLRVQFRSDIPLSAEGYFRVWLNTRFPEIRETVTNTITQIVPGKASKFGLNLNLSGGYGFLNKKLDLFLGAGIYYRIEF